MAGNTQVQPKALKQRDGTRRLRVLQMCAVDFTVQQFLLPLAGALKEDGFDVTIACSRGSYFDSIRAAGFDIRENPVSRSANVFHHLASLWRTFRFIRREQFDVVHAHTPIAALIGRAAAFFARVPVKIYTAHGFYFHDEMPGWKRKAHIALERIGALMGDFIMTVSREDEETALRLRIARPEQIETIYNGVDVARFDPARFPGEQRARFRGKLGIGEDAPVIGIVGRLVREKGFFEFFDAAASVLSQRPDARFMVVGDVLSSDYDAGKNEFHSKLRELGILDRFVFTGMVEDTAPYLNAMDIFCLPSYREGMPVSLLEAMAMALPAVATNIRGCREEVAEGETGWLVPTRNAAVLADRILWLLENPGRSNEMGKAGRARVIGRFEIGEVLRHQVAIYRRLTARLRD